MKTLLLIVVVVGLAIYQFWPKIEGWMDSTDYSNIGGDTVILFSTDWCEDCKKVRGFFDARQIRYTEYDVEKSERGRDELTQLGGNAVPFILIGTNAIDGYDKAAITGALQSLRGVAQ